MSNYSELKGWRDSVVTSEVRSAHTCFTSSEEMPIDSQEREGIGFCMLPTGKVTNIEICLLI